ncbi:putative methyltransferase-domain-containing protein [Suillus paluster]|uniref:putative methyltransferase-domain-containing protein n=1 Tax=Suillus paluster TaxID=48578 RepID=UPI001B868A38|nr:putative methyltransferase-domain-containing protein [Suillus paluster]KAG1717652.1 putative methyltransferase-domain-containing protein [Suillus paluster]
MLKTKEKRTYSSSTEKNIIDNERTLIHSLIIALLYPSSPDTFDWSTHYPGLKGTPAFADIGCGFGGFLITLAPLFPDTLMLGQSRNFVFKSHNTSTIDHRTPPPLPPHIQNVSVLRANAMKFLPNFFPKASLTALFFLFPDPHFKARKHKARIISPTLLAEYAYVLAPGGIVYTITDFVEEQELRNEGKGPILDAVYGATEEGKKVERNAGEKWLACFRRIEVKRQT